jgi:hypothetical protein
MHGSSVGLSPQSPIRPGRRRNNASLSPEIRPIGREDGRKSCYRNSPRSWPAGKAGSFFFVRQILFAFCDAAAEIYYAPFGILIARVRHDAKIQVTNHAKASLASKIRDSTKSCF